jgi:hypothetical protein
MMSGFVGGVQYLANAQADGIFPEDTRAGPRGIDAHPRDRPLQR